MRSVLFDGNNFNNFPINYFNDFIIYLSEKFKPENNVSFLKKVVIKGIKVIYLYNKSFGIFDLIIKDSKEVESDIVPTMYYVDTNEIIVTKMCNQCGPIFLELNLLEINTIKNIIKGY